MLVSESLKTLPGIAHGFFTRARGVSQGFYASLNCGPGSNDLPEHVQENRKRACIALGAKAENLCTLYQVHGKTVHALAAPLGDIRPEGDALVTKTPGIILGILTADCAPVLLADSQAGVIGAAHAGWRGAIGGVLPAIVDVMETLGASRGRIVAAVGPCIGVASYEVDESFRQRFLAQDLANDAFFAPPRKPGHPHFDLSGYVRHRLTQYGVGKVEILPQDTYADEARFFSFRRTTQRREPDYGRQLSTISLRP